MSITLVEQGQARAAVVAAALSWVGTPYHHHARVKGPRGGVDCAQILIAVYAGLGLAPEVDPGHYPTDWHLNETEELYESWLKAAGAVQTSEPPLPGDVALFRFGRTYSHSAICLGDDTFVHAYLGRGVIVSRGCEEPLDTRPMRVWRVIGV